MFKLVYMFTGQTDHFPFLSSAIWALRGLKYMCPVQNHIIAFIRATAVCYEKNANLFQNEDLSSLFLAKPEDVFMFKKMNVVKQNYLV